MKDPALLFGGGGTLASVLFRLSLGEWGTVASIAAGAVTVGAMLPVAWVRWRDLIKGKAKE